MARKVVELLTIWVFTCPDCKHVNYHGGKPIKDEELRKEAVAELGEGDLVFMPEQVWCQKCEGHFDVKMPPEQDD